MALRLQRIRSEEEDLRSEIAPYHIVAYPADYTLEGLHEKWKQKEIIIPPIQRHYVWTILQASRLIESFLLALPVPGIFFYKHKQNEDLLVIDGQQRLQSVFAFFEGKMPDSNQPFTLRGVQPAWEGKSYIDLTKQEQHRLNNSVLRATIDDSGPVRP